MDAQALAERVAQVLFAADASSKNLGMQILGVGPGTATLTMPIKAHMLNGHQVCHGGLIFALADSAFAFACNSYGDNTIAASGSIDFLAPGREGDLLTATAKELWRSRRTGIYEAVVTRQDGERVALFRGRSHRIEGKVLSP
jgi:acyl-CoA thioesterase